MSWPTTTHAKTLSGLAETWERFASDVESSTSDVIFVAEGGAFRAAAQQLRALVAARRAGGQAALHDVHAHTSTLQRIADLLGLPPETDLAVGVERAIRAAVASGQTGDAPVLWQYRLREWPGAAWESWHAVPANQLADWQAQIGEMPETAEIRPLCVALSRPANKSSRYSNGGRAFQTGGRS